jgi:hypothetical protein
MRLAKGWARCAGKGADNDGLSAHAHKMGPMAGAGNVRATMS